VAVLGLGEAVATLVAVVVAAALPRPAVVRAAARA